MMLGQSLKNYFRRASLAQKLVDDAESIHQDSEIESVRECPFTEIQINEEKEEDIQLPTTDYESTVGRKDGQGAALNVKLMAKMFSEKGIVQNIPQSAKVVCQETTTAKLDKVEKARPPQRSESMTSSNASVSGSPNTFPERVQLPTKMQIKQDSEIKSVQEDTKKRKRRRLKRSNKRCKESDTESCESEELKNANWTFRENNEKKDNYIKITMKDLKELISGGKGAHVQNTTSKQDIEMKLRRLESAENDCTDTETLNSGLSYSSGNSQDALLPIHKRTSSLHLVNPARVGILKRFLPSINVEESHSSDSVQTADTYLFDMPTTPRQHYPEKRRKSLQPEMLRYYDNCHSSLHTYTDVLKGTSRRHHYPNKEYYDFSCRPPSMKPIKSSRYGVTFGDEHYYDRDQEDEFDSNPYSSYRLLNSRKPMMAPNRRVSVQPESVWNTPINMPINRDPQLGFTQPSQLVQVPVPVLVNQQPAVSPGQIPSVSVAIPSAAASPPQNDDILQQLQNALDNGALDPEETTFPPQSEDVKASKKEDNSLEAHLNRVREMMAERKKRSEENKPFLIAKILTLIANALLLLCSGGIVGIGILYMVNDSAIYTGVTQSDGSDQNFQFFCYTLCLIGGLVLAILVCGFCGSIKAKQACLKLFMIAVGVALMMETGLIVFLYIMNSTSVPVFSLISSAIETSLIKQLREVIIYQYVDGSVAATAWDNIQVMGECCGCMGAEDYTLSSWKNATTTDKKQGVPNSCCVLKEKNPSDPVPTNKLLCHTMISGFWHKRGCIEVLREWYHNLSLMTLAIAGGLFIIEILCIIFALRLFMKTKQKKEREEKRKKEALEKEKRENEKIPK